ncbi:MAG: hypothetical protein U5K38_12935 [Woeseiaceae bacterium]|nr:hypothetical protein [Woeseiaceae bacterium]
MTIDTAFQFPLLKSLPPHRVLKSNDTTTRVISTYPDHRRGRDVQVHAGDLQKTRIAYSPVPVGFRTRDLNYTGCGCSIDWLFGPNKDARAAMPYTLKVTGDLNEFSDRR